MCGYVPTVVCENVRGRPRLEVKQKQLEYLLELGFKCSKIAEVLGVSLSTVRRRMSKFGLSVTALYSQVTDQELDEIVSEIKHDFPKCGSRLMYGHLVGRGHRVSHAHISESAPCRPGRCYSSMDFGCPTAQVLCIVTLVIVASGRKPQINQVSMWGTSLIYAYLTKGFSKCVVVV